MRCCIYFTVCTLICFGCTTNSLRRNTLWQTESVADLRNLEILENLAMLDVDPQIIPAYSSIFAGNTTINDSVAISPAAGWIAPVGANALRTRFLMENLDVTGQRVVTQTWTLDPTIVPEKLRAIRAVFSRVLEKEVIGDDYNLLTDGTGMNKSTVYFNVASQLEEIRPGHTWLHRADCHRDIPKSACFRASYRGHYVWVDEDGIGALSDLALVLQEIARTDFSLAVPPKTTTWKFTIDKVGTITANFDSHDQPTAADSSLLPAKDRKDNVGGQSDLKAQIASAKSQ